MAIWGNASDLEDFSFSATVVPFDPPIPLLRGPVPAGSSDDPSAGPFVLAFKDAATWSSAFQATQSKIIDQCQNNSGRFGVEVAKVFDADRRKCWVSDAYSFIALAF